ncbi:hypothetical protein IWX91DRAFT_127489 [Phyllosticta citricarpa]
MVRIGLAPFAPFPVSTQHHQLLLFFFFFLLATFALHCCAWHLVSLLAVALRQLFPTSYACLAACCFKRRLTLFLAPRQSRHSAPFSQK